MSQNDDQNRDPQDQVSDDSTRDTRGVPSNSRQNRGTERQEQSSDLPESDDLDEDRDDDWRPSGGPNRRFNIG